MLSSKKLISVILLLLAIAGGYLWYEREKALEPRRKQEARRRVLQEFEREWERLSLPAAFRIIKQTPPSLYEELSHTPFCYGAITHATISTVYDKAEAVHEFMAALPPGEWKGGSPSSWDVIYLKTRFEANSGHGILQFKQLSDEEIRVTKLKTDDDYPSVIVVSLVYHPSCANIGF
ncbi:MAG: hypothetical protein JOZ51_27360 [Chloroflexi bacterium]|nr:hypothetical protein [Chloroflexota bacterium]